MKWWASPLVAALYLGACGLLVRKETRTIEVVVERTKQCVADPPPGEVPLVDGGDGACPAGYDFCLTAEGSAALAKLYLWASGAWVKCGPPPAPPLDAGPQ